MAISILENTISVLKLDKIKLNGNQYGEYYFLIRSETGQDKTEWQSVGRITVSFLTLDKIKLNDNQYDELLVQF